MNNKINKNFLVALLIEGDTYTCTSDFFDYQIISAENEQIAENIYNKKNNCEKFSGVCVGEIIDYNNILLSDYFKRKLLKITNDNIDNQKEYIILGSIEQDTDENIYKDINIYPNNDNTKQYQIKNNLTEIGTYNPNNNIMLIKFEYIDFITYIENNSLNYLNEKEESKLKKLLKKISYKK